MNQSAKRIDKVKFGPWAIVTGASSGIGKEFSRQLAANGLNIVLVARRLELLKELGQNLEKEFGVQCRAVQVDLSDENFIGTVKEATQDLDIGLVVSNAGTGNPGSFIKKNRDDLLIDVRLSVTAHLELCHHFAPVLVKRGHGGILLVGAMGASHGVPHMANSRAAKGYPPSVAQKMEAKNAEKVA
jgi:short-subunit dehydrogenase